MPSTTIWRLSVRAAPFTAREAFLGVFDAATGGLTLRRLLIKASVPFESCRCLGTTSSVFMETPLSASFLFKRSV